MSFPLNPSINDIHSISDNGWRYDGYGWVKMLGATSDYYVRTFNGYTGDVVFGAILDIDGGTF